jgi:hypothetical protein
MPQPCAPTKKPCFVDAARRGWPLTPTLSPRGRGRKSPCPNPRAYDAEYFICPVRLIAAASNTSLNRWMFSSQRKRLAYAAMAGAFHD